MTESLPGSHPPQHAPLLATKLHIPPLRPNLVPRPRLIQQLDGGLRLGCKLTVVSAPAGYGKTTLVAEWISQYHTAWLSLDHGDNDPARFFAYLVAALQAVEPNVGRGPAGRLLGELLDAPKMPPVASLVACLINDIDALPANDPAAVLLLVLDDYHAISELAIHEAIGLLLERQPARMHLVITTRQDPPLPLSRLRGRGQVTEIREQDLCFTSSEAAAFLNQTMGLHLTAGDIAALEARTEGWIAGLQMAALSMVNRDAESATRFVAGFTGRHQFILDYLTDEVLAGQPQPIQEFLLRTSILDRLSAPLCDAVTSNLQSPISSPQYPISNVQPPIPNTQSLLEHIDVANLFIVPLDAERRWYRYHRLFADLLQARLQAAQPALVPELHRRAAAWHEQNGLGAEAVAHALATGNHELAAGIIERVIRRVETWSRIDNAIYLDWYRALPYDVVQARPRLRLFAGRALYATGQTGAGEQILRDLERALDDGSLARPAPTSEPAPPEVVSLPDQILSDLASFAAVRGDLRQAIAYARRALDRLPEDDALARIRPTSVLGLAHLRAGEVTEAGQSFSDVIATARAANLEFAVVPFVCNLADVQFVQGQLRQAFHTFQRAMQVGTVEGRRTTVTGFAGLGLGRIHYEWNQLEAAEGHVREGLEQLRQGGIPASFGIGHTLLAQIRQAQGDAEGAQAAMEQAVQLAQASSITRISVLASAHQARLWLAQGGLDRAAQWARDYQQLDPTEYLREFEELTLARVLLAKDDAPGALDLLDRLLPPARAAGRMATVLEVHALRALALATTGDLDAALDALARALELAAPEGYVRLFLDAGEPMARLLYHAARCGIEPASTQELLSAFKATKDERRRTKSHSPPSDLRHPSLVEPLTPRELDVLRLLAEDLILPEIAQRLFISRATVKTHTRNLYGKLGVHNRREAVAAARQLGLL
jgi:LuxR family maltose regulon positive regulatory protein